MGELNGVATVGGHNAALASWQHLALQAQGGNVGIGTTSPAASLQVQGSANAWSTWVNGNSNTGQSYGLTVRAGTNTSDHPSASNPPPAAVLVPPPAPSTPAPPP